MPKRTQRYKRRPLVRGLMVCLALWEPRQLKAEESPRAELTQEQLNQAREQCDQEHAAGRYAQALPACQEVLRAAKRTLGAEDPSVAYWSNEVGLDLHHLGRSKEAEPLYRRSLQIREKVLGAEHPDVATSLNNLAALCDSQGKYVEAEPLYRRSLQISEKVLGAEHPGVATSLNNLAALYYSQGKYVEAEPLLRRSLQIREKVLGAEHPGVAASLNNLAGLYCQQGKYVEAEPLHRRSLQIREKVLGAEHPDVADSLNNLAELYRAQGKYVEAEPLYRRSLQIREKVLGAEHPDVADSLNNLAGLYREQGKYVEAEPLLRRSLQIKEKVLGAQHPDVARSLNNLAALYVTQGKYVEAEPLLRRSLQIKEKVLGAEHPDLAASLHNLAALYVTQGKYVEAEPLHRRSLQIREKVLGAEHPDLAASLHNLAGLYHQQGKYVEAEPLIRRSLQIREKVLGAEHPEVATSLNNLALLYEAQGKYVEAEPLIRRSLQIREKVLGAEHPEVATSLNNLALLYEAQGKYVEAEPLYRRSLQISEKVLGAEHPEVATFLNNLAALYRAQGKYVEAEPLYRRSLQILEKVLGAEHRDVAASLNNLAELYRMQGKYGEAEPLLRRSLQISEKVLGAEHPHVATSLNNLALLYEAQGKSGEAEPLYRRSLQIGERVLGAEHPDVALMASSMHIFSLRKTNLPAALTAATRLSTAEAAQLTVQRTSASVRSLQRLSMARTESVYGMLKDQANLADLRSLVLRNVLIRKGQVVDAAASDARYRRAIRLNPQKQSLFAELDAARDQYEQWAYSGPRALSVEAYKNRLTQLSQQIERLEHQVALDNPSLRSKTPIKHQQILEQVAAQLRKQDKPSALIEIIRTHSYRLGALPKDDRWEEAHYYGLVLYGSGETVAKDLGPASAIDQAIGQMLAVLQDPSSNPQPVAQDVYRQVMEPLEKHLTGIEKLYISPDGALQMLPFAALHNGKQYLLENKRQLVYVTSGRELLQRTDPVPSQAPVVLADPSLGKSSPLSEVKDGRVAMYQQLQKLEALSGARDEGQRLGKLMSAVTLVGPQASEKAVRQLHSPAILHLATHGLFVEDPEAPEVKLSGAALAMMGGRRGAGDWSPGASEKRGVLGVAPVVEFALPQVPTPGTSVGPAAAGKPVEHAMVRGVLVLAGAKEAAQAAKREEDGVLTAVEVEDLDLVGTQLVVMSACETEKGSVKDGEGVEGLRSAFRVAGAETVVGSLWLIADRQTGKLMEKYYEKMWKGKKGRLSALQEAMQETKNTAETSHPYYWAGFIGVGSDEPLRPWSTTPVR